MSDTENNNNAVEDQPKEEKTHVQLKIAGAGFPDLLIRVKPTTKLAKMMSAYCDRAGKSMSEVRFVFDGNKLSPTQTVSELDIDEDDDEVLIEVFSEAVGGSA